jgi:hypothetical protein
MNGRKNMEKGTPKFHGPAIAVFRASPLKKNCGRKQKYNHQEVWDAIALVSLHKRKTLQKLASFIGILLTTVHRMKQDPLDNVIILHSNAIKPHLHNYHQLGRLLYAVDNLDLGGFALQCLF